MVREALLSRAPIPVDHVHAVPTLGLTPEAAATVYERTLNSFYGADRLAPERPLFDAILLGLGPDGHTASLFAGTAVLEERERWVAAVLGAKDEARITLTYPVPESSRHTAFLVAGAEKRAVLAALRRGDGPCPPCVSAPPARSASSPTPLRRRGADAAKARSSRPVQP